MSDLPPQPPPAHRPSRSGRAARKVFHTGWPAAAVGVISLAAGQLGGQPPSPPPAPQPAAQAALSNGGQPAPVPLLAVGKPVDWWFAYKFSSSDFPSEDDDPARACPFGGQLRHADFDFSQKYVIASRDAPQLTDGQGLIGTSLSDPLGATFSEIYNGAYYFVVWNDQFKGDPQIKASSCSKTDCDQPWGHSKGVLAWDATGAGVVLQVTTPSWPGSGTNRMPRADGNTLGCISNDDNVSNAQDFFSLRLSRDDVKTVLKALALSSVSTDTANPQLANLQVNGAPVAPDFDPLVRALGQLSPGSAFLDQPLSSGVRLLAKSSGLKVPPWQFVSSRLGGEPLRAATWWASPRMPSSHPGVPGCWDASLPTAPGEVQVAVSGAWETNHDIGLTGAPNHAKVGVSLPSGHHYAIFGDLNQQGHLSGTCASAQNQRGGMFFVMQNQALADSLSALLTGKTAPYGT